MLAVLSKVVVLLRPLGGDVTGDVGWGVVRRVGVGYLDACYSMGGRDGL